MDWLNIKIKNVSDAKDRLKKDGVVSSEVIDSLGRKQQATVINEQNLYKVIFQSRKQEAEQFQDWVTGEVLERSPKRRPCIMTKVRQYPLHFFPKMR